MSVPPIMRPYRGLHEGPRLSLAVLSRHCLDAWRPDRPWALISINDPGDGDSRLPLRGLLPAWVFFDDPKPEVILLGFGDVEQDRPDLRGMNECEAQGIACFVRQALDRACLIVCQCRMGLSRSAAVANAIWTHHHGEDPGRFGAANGYHPNPRVYRMVLEALRNGDAGG